MAFCGGGHPLPRGIVEDFVTAPALERDRRRTRYFLEHHQPRHLYSVSLLFLRRRIKGLLIRQLESARETCLEWAPGGANPSSKASPDA